jgi:hypothetical protein
LLYPTAHRPSVGAALIFSPYPRRHLVPRSNLIISAFPDQLLNPVSLQKVRAMPAKRHTGRARRWDGTSSLPFLFSFFLALDFTFYSLPPFLPFLSPVSSLLMRMRMDESSAPRVFSYVAAGRTPAHKAAAQSCISSLFLFFRHHDRRRWTLPRRSILVEFLDLTLPIHSLL